MFSLRAQVRSTTGPFAQLSLILAHLQHSKFNTVQFICTSHSSCNTWNASLVVCRHGCAVACALKNTFVQYNNFSEWTMVTIYRFHESCADIISEPCAAREKSSFHHCTSNLVWWSCPWRPCLQLLIASTTFVESISFFVKKLKAGIFDGPQIRKLIKDACFVLWQIWCLLLGNRLL